MIKFRTWYDELIWCPSQCFYYFKYNNSYYCIYLRWRWSDPWTADLLKFRDDTLELDTAEWKSIEIKNWKQEDDLNKIKNDAIKKVKKYLNNSDDYKT